MVSTLTASFATRREAEMTVERVVQEQDIDRDGIVIATSDDDNSVGQKIAGSDADAGEPGPEGLEDAALNGPVTVSVRIGDEVRAGEIRKAFAEFDANNVAAD